LPSLNKYKTLILDKISIHTVKNQHPWIFSKRIEKSSKEFLPGDFIRLIDAENNYLGTGIFSGSKDLISIRVFAFDSELTYDLIKKRLITSIEKRLPLLVYTDSFRLIHGENDLLPGINVDYHSGTIILRYYSKSLYVFSRMILRALWNLIWNNPNWNLRIENAYIQAPKRIGKNNIQFLNSFRVVRGIKHEYIKIRYRDITYLIKPDMQKGGIYNDIRNLRDYLWLHKSYVYEKNVLNLFSNNGLLSKCLVNLGAKKVYSIEDSKECIDVHTLNSAKNPKEIVIKKNLFTEYDEFAKKIDLKYELIIVDPPSLTASAKDKPKAIIIYKKLISISLGILAKDGILILCSCSNRIHTNEFENISKIAFAENEVKMKRLDRLKNEIDHPILDNFPEGDYFKVHIYKKI
jgi:23S rRNA G2069 N7-methylase RlmK/C1962 C5-methylase RlmI